jgi:hypothetical protein
LNEKSTMRRSQRLIAAAVLIALSGALAGCSGGGISSFDPSDMLDFLDTKKKLQGERKPVFPDGVPGLEQGVPKSLYKGASQQEIDQQNAAALAAPPQPQPVEKPKRVARSKKPPAADSAADPAAAPAAGTEGDAAAAVPPAPKPKKIVRQRTTAPPPDQPTAQSAPSDPAGQQPAQPTQQSAAPFPAPLPGGTFTR